MGSSRTRDQTRVPCIGRRILSHCATREVPPFGFDFPFDPVVAWQVDLVGVDAQVEFHVNGGPAIPGADQELHRRGHLHSAQ